MTENFQKNIDKYMDLKGIKYYSNLLIMIGKKMGMNQQQAMEFSKKEKSNFSKMLKGERPLKIEYVAPIEEILGVPLAKIINEKNYNVSINKDDIPFIKGFRYYAYYDELNLYDELDELVDINGEYFLNNSDEFNRFFLDYLIEYKAYNGLRFLVEKHNFHSTGFNGNNYINDENYFAFSSRIIEIAKFVINSNDVELFNKVYDVKDYAEYLLKYHIKGESCLYNNKEFIETIVNNSNIYDMLFKNVSLEFKTINKYVSNFEKDTSQINVVNPLINFVLDYCLEHIEKYKKQAKEILKFAIRHISDVSKNLLIQSNCFLDERGSVKDRSNAIIANIIFTNVKKTSCNEINILLEKLDTNCKNM